MHHRYPYVLQDLIVHNIEVPQGVYGGEVVGYIHIFELPYNVKDKIRRFQGSQRGTTNALCLTDHT
jgi:hypothetical protein